jgi:hypothetical protein
MDRHDISIFGRCEWAINRDLISTKSSKLVCSSIFVVGISFVGVSEEFKHIIESFW